MMTDKRRLELVQEIVSSIPKDDVYRLFAPVIENYVYDRLGVLSESEHDELDGDTAFFIDVAKKLVSQ